jgi:hypothetical protein
MGRADSELRDRVIFVEGAPRSGTTWLVTLLATHPDIAGVEAESHLFDYGAERLLDNFDGRHPALHGLQSYLDRDELVDLVRGLCDGVLLAMRRHTSRGTEPSFVVEKTPISPEAGALDLARKLETFPDAWYIHIVRKRDDVARSLMRAPWMEDRSYESCAAVWDETVGRARATLGGCPRYREVSYEDLRHDPAGTCRELFAWLGLRHDEEKTLARVAILSREPFSDLGAVPRAIGGPMRSRLVIARRGMAALSRAHLGQLLPWMFRERGEAAGQTLAFSFVQALRARNAEALDALTESGFQLIIRREDGDVVAHGTDARAGLVALAEKVFDRRYVSEWWASAGAGPGEWWTRAPGTPFCTVFVSALGGDSTRVDLGIGLVTKGDLISRAVVISAGALEGREVVSASTNTV